MVLKVRVDQKRLGRKWLYPKCIRVCREDGKQVALIELDESGRYMRVSHIDAFSVYDQVWSKLGEITIPTVGGKGEN